jgi:hypothetical protein
MEMLYLERSIFRNTTCKPEIITVNSTWDLASLAMWLRRHIWPVSTYNRPYVPPEPHRKRSQVPSRIDSYYFGFTCGNYSFYLEIPHVNPK